MNNPLSGTHIHPFVLRTLEAHWFDSFRMANELARHGSIRTRFGRFPGSTAYESAALPWALPDCRLTLVDGIIHADMTVGDGTIQFVHDADGARFRMKHPCGTIVERADQPLAYFGALSAARQKSRDPALALVESMREDAPEELDAALAQHWIRRAGDVSGTAPVAALSFDPHARHRGRLWLVVADESMLPDPDKAVPGRIRFHQTTSTWWIDVDAMSEAESHALHRILPAFELRTADGSAIRYRPIRGEDNVTTLPVQRASTAVYVPARHDGVHMEAWKAA